MYLQVIKTCIAIFEMMTRYHFVLDDDYICGLAAICMCIMTTFVSAKDSCIKPVQIQNKYAEKNY